MTEPWQVEKDPAVLRRVGKTGEESAELSKICSRIVIQGIDGIDPESEKENRLSLTEEIADVIAQSILCVEELKLDKKLILSRMCKKIGQMEEWEDLLK